jgi:outer membrane protein assembly factor BamB
MPSVRFVAAALLLHVICWGADWPGFRGHNATGISTSAKNLPVEFGPEKNVIWKTPLPPGHSSPVVVGGRIYVTAIDQEKLFVFALDRATGKIAWRREVPRPRKQELHASNSAASPSVATDGRNTFAFFTDFGLISYGPDGEERWRVPLGPFNNPFGMGASPVLADGKVIQVCDSETGSFIIAVDQKDGRTHWRKERPDVTRGFSTPVLYKTGGRTQAIVAGSNILMAYDAATGDEIWWVRGLTWQMKPTPVVDGEIGYVLGWAGGSDQGNQENLPSWRDVLAAHDVNRDGKLAKEELDQRWQKDFAEGDLDRDGFYGERDWDKYRAKRASVNSIMAVRLGGKGDVTEKNVLWQYYKSLPNATSPLFYEGVVYLMKEGGILTTLDAKTGKMIKQGRLPGAIDYYYASPVGADGKVYAVSENCHVSVLKAGGEWDVLARNDFDDSCFTTPAPVDDRLFLRTRTALYAFGLNP